MKTRFLSYFLVLIFVVLIPNRAISRREPNGASDLLILDGVDGRIEEDENTFSVIRLEEEEACEQMYGFLPCSKSIWGHVFLIVVYEYLLFHGESYVAAGGERIFKILGPGVFGACAFQIIGAFPEALILLVSGLLNNKEVAQECVLTGVGLLAGSSILLLTLVWGTCVILGSQHFPNSSQSSDSTNQNPIQNFFLSLWPGYGVVTDSWTGYTAWIMLISAIPFTIIQFPVLFDLSYFWERIFVVVALLVSVTFLLSYFFYQLFQPWIQGRQLLYLKHGHLVVDILKHVQNHTNETLFSDDGAPDLSVIRRIFKVTDRDGDETIDASELKGFLQEIKFRKMYSDKDKATQDMMKEFDVDDNKKININEFVKGMEKWVEETKKDSGETYRLDEVPYFSYDCSGKLTYFRIVVQNKFLAFLMNLHTAKVCVFCIGVEIGTDFPIFAVSNPRFYYFGTTFSIPNSIFCQNFLDLNWIIYKIRFLFDLFGSELEIFSTMLIPIGPISTHSFVHQVLRPWMEKKREEREIMKNIVPEILEHLQSSTHGSLLTEDGTPDIPAIKRLFKDIDHDKDDLISYSELRDLMMDIKFGSIPHDIDEAASKMMEELDISGDKLINEDEFVTGLSNWLNAISINQTPKPEQINEESDYHQNWEETDKLVESKFVDKSPFAWIKAISLLVLGIVMLGLLAEPLIHSVQSLSKAASIPSFFIAFIFVPLATNARITISAIGEVRRKKLNITSLTFSEIYGTVLMNNLLGFSVLLSLIYFRGFSWDFSVEVLMVLIVCAVMGCLASFSTVFPVWTAVFACMLYPLSLVLVTVLGDFNWL
ncbi:PREDICTED: uncharacterized protein LOC105968479 [Erythranthe guttata]|uniref:uncharacterized protein LOC105968479 n=1 Tax=Erythranthe guttata TaxID=4155 RepID=UPI00064E030C|nr:PREDICTED: uncharacterized protein LOC105968479 [Erythranthe guttata]|eukprot:XP_012848571.1 PREDICTED: uncharacterized protein LOC105968479 [Erythranthe guttata]